MSEKLNEVDECVEAIKSAIAYDDFDRDQASIHVDYLRTAVKAITELRDRVAALEAERKVSHDLLRVSRRYIEYCNQIPWSCAGGAFDNSSNMLYRIGMHLIPPASTGSESGIPVAGCVQGPPSQERFESDDGSDSK